MLSELGKYGASFVLATQTLAKLADLSPTMQDTILANVGCLAVFQVAGSDARQLVWELGRDRVSEEDIVSLPVHHCYIRATVGSERTPAFSMSVLKPEEGDAETAASIREASADYTTSAADLAAKEAHHAEGRVREYQEGLKALEASDTAERPPPRRRRKRSRRPRDGGERAQGGAGEEREP